MASSCSPLGVRMRCISNKLHFFSTYPSCQSEPSGTLGFIGSNDPRLLPADQSHVNACCSDEGGGVGYLETLVLGKGPEMV